MPRRFAEVALLKPALQKPLTYSIPEESGKCPPGSLVLVPFKEKEQPGIVWKLSGASHVPTRPIQAITDFKISEELMKLADFMHRFYLASHAQVLSLFLPPLDQLFRLKIACRTEALNPLDPWDAAFLKRKTISFSTLQKKFGKSFRKLLRENLKSGRFALSYESDALDFSFKAYVARSTSLCSIKLTAAQKKAYQELLEIRQQKPGALLFGVPGAGKTETYLQIVHDVLREGKRALLLVPEIALTPQLKARVENALGLPVALYHSYRSQRERAKLYGQIQAGCFPVVLGTRSSLFLDIPDLGLIVVDEEQEPSYKNEQGICYHAREVALEKAKLCGAFCLFVSATPSCEIFHLAREGKIGLVRLSERFSEAKPPVITVCDMRKGKKNGPFHTELLTRIRNTIETGEQVVLLYNRRGFAPYLICLYCGSVVRCPDCDVSFVYHLKARKFFCHHCHRQAEEIRSCPACRSPYLKKMGYGTEKIAEKLKALFPKASLCRLDLDATKETSMGEVIEKMSKGDIALLVGTQMVAKGLDLPKVTLAAVLSFEHALHFPDFRSEERAFHLLSQLAGRAGRRAKQGEVVIQAYKPDSDLLKKVRNGEVEAFLEEELARRKALFFPPYCRLLRVIISHPRKEKAHALSEKAAAIFQIGPSHKRRWLSKEGVMEISRPAPCPLFKERGKYRYAFLLKSQPGKLMLPHVARFLDLFGNDRRFLKLDFEPLRML